MTEPQVNLPVTITEPGRRARSHFHSMSRTRVRDVAISNRNLINPCSLRCDYKKLRVHENRKLSKQGTAKRAEKKLKPLQLL